MKMRISESRKLREFVRCSSGTRYKMNWHLEQTFLMLERFITDVKACLNPILIIDFPPRHGKSHIASTRFPLWCMLNNPNWEVVIASYAADLAESMSRKCKQVAESDWVRKYYGNAAMVAKGQNRAEEWAIGNGSTLRAVGRGGGLTGRGFNIGVIDDVLKDRKEADSPTIRKDCIEWFESVFLTREYPVSGIVVIATRWHIGDLSGHLLEKHKDGELGRPLHHVSFKALATEDEKHRKKGEALFPRFYPEEKLAAKRKLMSPREWQSLYQQSPILDGGNLFNPEDFVRSDHAFGRKPKMSLITADLRFKKAKESGSYVCIQLWVVYNGFLKLVLMERGRWGYVDTKTKLKAMMDSFPTAPVYIEHKANADAIEDDLSRLGYSIKFWEPTASKEARAEYVLDLVKGGKVHIAPDLEQWSEFEKEVQSFPRGDSDDIVDTMTMALTIYKDTFELAIDRYRKLAAMGQK